MKISNSQINQSGRTTIFLSEETKVIPFIVVDVLQQIYDSIFEILAHDPSRFSELIADAFIGLLKRLFGIETKANEHYILIPEIGMQDLRAYYRVPLEVLAVIGDPKSIIDRLMREYTDLKMYIVLAPSNVVISRSEWNFIIIRLAQGDLYSLAAKGYIDANPRYREYLIANEWNKFADSFVQNYNIKERVENWLLDGIKHGVVLQPHLKSSHILETRKIRGDAVFFNRYKLLLSCGNNFTREQLLDLLLKMYKSSPFGVNVWCGTTLLTAPLEDLETVTAQNTESIYKMIDSAILLTLRIAEVNMMASEYKDNRISLELHPAERRILRILDRSSGKVERDQLKRFFIFLSRDGRSETKILDNLIDMLVYRGLIEVHSKKILKLIKNPLSKELETERLYETFKDSVQDLLEVLGKLGALQGFRDTRNALLHILVTKEKEWKLIQLRDVIDTVEALRKRYMDCRAPSTLITLENFLRLAFRILEFIKGAVIDMNAVIARTDDMLNRINRMRNEIRSKLRAIIGAEIDLPNDVVELVESNIRKLSLRIHEYPRAITKGKLMSIINLKLEQKSAEASRIWEIFRFDSGCNSSSKFNIVLHVLLEMHKEFEKESQEYVNKLQEIIDLLSDIETKSKQVPSETCGELIRRALSAQSLGSIISNLRNVSKQLDEDIKRYKEILRLKEEGERIRRRIEDTLGQIIEIKRELEYYRTALADLNIPRFDTTKKLKKAMSEVSSVESLLNDLLNRVSKSQVSKNSIEDAKDGLAQAFNQIHLLKAEIFSLDQAIRREMKSNYIDPLLRQIEVFRNQIKDIQILSQILAIAEDIKCLEQQLDKAEAKSLQGIVLKINEINGSWAEVRRRCIEYLFKVKGMSQKHIAALELLLSEFLGKDFTLKELLKELMSKLGISEKEVLEILLALEDSGIVNIFMRVERHL
ncbi:MAG: hypothetical protein QW143_05900 [Candidatus Korarchaeota archaeon]